MQLSRQLSCGEPGSWRTLCSFPGSYHVANRTLCSFPGSYHVANQVHGGLYAAFQAVIMWRTRFMEDFMQLSRQLSCGEPGSWRTLCSFPGSYHVANRTLCSFPGS